VYLLGSIHVLRPGDGDLPRAALEAYADAEPLLAILDRHPQVRGVAWGHAHQSLDRFRGATRLMCTPSTCMQFRPRDPGFIVDDRPPGYRVLDLHDDGGIATEVVWLEGYTQ
jgi:Icc protein